MRDASADPVRLDAFVERTAALVGLKGRSDDSERDGTDDLLLALAPTLRLNLLHLSSEQVLHGLALSELLIRRLIEIPKGLSMPGGPADISTAKGAFEVLGHVGPALRLLARADERIELPASASKKVPPFGFPDMSFAAFKLLRGSGNSSALIDTLEEVTSPLTSVSDRMAFMVEMGRQIEPALLRKKRKRNGLKPVAVAR